MCAFDLSFPFYCCCFCMDFVLHKHLWITKNPTVSDIDYALLACMMFVIHKMNEDSIIWYTERGWERVRVLRKRECWCEFPFQTEKRAFDENWLHNTFVALTSSQSVGGSGLCCFQLRLTSASAKCLLCVYQMMNARALTVFIFVLLFALENRVHTLRHKHRTHSQNELSFSRILILSVDVC